MANGPLACREENSNGWQRAEVIRLEQDVFTALAGSGKLYVYKTDGFWSQIKSAGYGLGQQEHREGEEGAQTRPGGWGWQALNLDPPLP